MVMATATLTKHKGELNLVWSEEKLENGSQPDYLYKASKTWLAARRRKFVTLYVFVTAYELTNLRTFHFHACP